MHDIICPHCHCPIDPLTLENAVGGGVRYLICPECDDLVALPALPADFDAALPARNNYPVESRVL